jgi:uncharacterized protein YjbI with pentapeptide repeats
MLFPLREILTLTSAYTPQASENALQILHWSCRVQTGTEENFINFDRLQGVQHDRFPIGIQLQGANLQKMTLDAIYLREVNLTEANLAGAKLNGADLSYAILEKAFLQDANRQNSPCA